jgi:hypothetical protein
MSKPITSPPGFTSASRIWKNRMARMWLTPQPLNNGGPALAAKPPLTQSVKRIRNEEPAFTRSVKIEPESITKSAIFPTMKRRTRKNRKNRKSRKSRKSRKNL